MKKIKPLNLVIVSLFSFLLASCNITANTKRLNRTEDKQAAEKVTSLLYSLLENKAYSKTHDLFSKDFWKVTKASDLDTLLNNTEEKLGKIKSKKVETWETSIISGTDPSSVYLLVYNVTREKYNSVETIKLTKEGDRIKIYSYNVKSEGFLH